MWALSWRSGSPRSRHRAAAATRAARRTHVGLVQADGRVVIAPGSTVADEPGDRHGAAALDRRRGAEGGSPIRRHDPSAAGEPPHARQSDQEEASAAEHGDQHEDGGELVAGPFHRQLAGHRDRVMNVVGRDDHEGEADRCDPHRADDPVGAPPEPGGDGDDGGGEEQDRQPPVGLDEPEPGHDDVAAHRDDSFVEPEPAGGDEIEAQHDDEQRGPRDPLQRARRSTGRSTPQLGHAVCGARSAPNATVGPSWSSSSMNRSWHWQSIPSAVLAP